MNVKPGQLAIGIKSGAGNEGRIVEVLGLMGENPFYLGEYWSQGAGFCWMVKGKLSTRYGKDLEHGPMPDSWLRPVSGLSDPVDGKNSIKEPA